MHAIVMSSVNLTFTYMLPKPNFDGKFVRLSKQITS